MNKILNSRHFRYGAPFLIAVVGGSFGLQYYSQLRYEVQKEKKITTKTKEVMEMIKPRKQISIEDAYEEYKQNVDLDNWQNVRGPRPWESDNEAYKEVIERRAKESKKQWVFK